jgi:hypothetical protein
LPIVQAVAEATQRVAHETTEMPAILYDENGQPVIQPYLHLQQQYEVCHERGQLS